MADDKMPDRPPAAELEGLTEQAVDPHHPTRPAGERQDGAGIAPPREDRTDGTPAGSTARARSGTRQGTGPSEDPFAAHRGDPATFATGAAQGSGASTGGGGAGESEQPDPDSQSGGGSQTPA